MNLNPPLTQAPQSSLTSMDINRALTYNGSHDMYRRPQMANQHQQQQQQLMTRGETVTNQESYNDKRWSALNALFCNSSDPYSIERAAKLYKNAACKHSFRLYESYLYNFLTHCPTFCNDVLFSIKIIIQT